MTTSFPVAIFKATKFLLTQKSPSQELCTNSALPGKDQPLGYAQGEDVLACLGHNRISYCTCLSGSHL